MQSGEHDRIFLCHASEDKPHALNMYRKLKSIGFNPWAYSFGSYSDKHPPAWRFSDDKKFGLSVRCIKND